ncbi:MAG: hypothetical protein FJ279_26465 [Planctomycetes bacterium]|nr:hypothetical protein [Planctomycetota bacterium]MBM4081673.1 hypothetical protein [Planctomycetota bacterium]MBM4086223.1 hypothetical protein [Planctomycetota bacterium]
MVFHATARALMALIMLFLWMGDVGAQARKEKGAKRSEDVKGWGKKGKAKDAEPVQPAGKGQPFEGVVLCAQHDLKQTEKCEAVLQVRKEIGGQVIYYLQANEQKADLERAALHQKAKVQVSGFPTAAGGKEFLTLTEFKLATGESPTGGDKEKKDKAVEKRE